MALDVLRHSRTASLRGSRHSGAALAETKTSSSASSGRSDRFTPRPSGSLWGRELAQDEPEVRLAVPALGEEALEAGERGGGLSAKRATKAPLRHPAPKAPFETV